MVRLIGLFSRQHRTAANCPRWTTDYARCTEVVVERRAEGIATRIQQNRYADVVGHGNVLLAIAIEIANRHLHRSGTTTARIVCRRLEAARSRDQQHAYVSD